MNIGKEGETIIVEPIPEKAPIEQPSQPAQPDREPEKVPA